MMADVAIALGSNVGDRLAWLATARYRLEGLLAGVQASSVYETDPVGGQEQPRYLNSVITGTTDLGPLDLLRALQRIERDLERERPFPNAPRTIDLDLLLYDDLTLSTPDLTLPHPQLHERFFVLVPLAELAPTIRHPRLDQTIEELLRGLGPASGIERIATETAFNARIESS